MSMRATPRSHRALASLGLASLLWAAGCASTPSQPPLEVTVTNLRITGATVFETTAIVDLRYENVTGEDLRVTGAAHRLTVNGLRLGRALSSESVAVPRLGSATQGVEVHLRNIALARLAHELGQSRTASYQLDGTVYLEGPGTRPRTLNIERSGALNLQGLGTAAAVP